jgi:Zn-dependent protease with chaperone function/DNA-binding beta-propeller fold protein YncE
MSLWVLRVPSVLLVMLALIGGCTQSAPSALSDDSDYFGTSYSLKLVGTVGRRWGEWGPSFDSADDFVVDQAGNVVSIQWNTLAKFGPDGQLMWRVEPSKSSSDEVDFLLMRADLEPSVALDDDGNVYVTDTTGHRILRYTPTGGLWWSSGQLGEGIGEFEYPTGIAVDQASNLYIADSGNRRVQKLDSTGNFVWEITSFEGYPSWIAVDERNRVYVLDNRLRVWDDGTWAGGTPWALLVFDTDGNLLHRLPFFEVFQHASYPVHRVMGLDRHRGHLFLIDLDRFQENFSIRAIDPVSGQLLMNISRPALADQEYQQAVHVPEGICVDGPRYLYYTLGRDLFQYRIVDGFWEAREEYLRGNYNTAASLLGEIVSIGPNNPNALYYLGHSLEQLGRPDQAIVYYRMAAQLAPHKTAGQAALVALDRVHPAPPARDPPNPPLVASAIVLFFIAIVGRIVSSRQVGSTWEAVYRFGATFRTVTLLACLTVLPLVLLVHEILNVGDLPTFTTRRLSQLEPWYLRFGWPGVFVAVLPELILYGLPGLVVLANGLSVHAARIGGEIRLWRKDDASYEDMRSCLRVAVSHLGLSASNIGVCTPRDPDEPYPRWRKAGEWFIRLIAGTTMTPQLEPFVFGRSAQDAYLFMPQRLFQERGLSKAEIQQVMIHELSHIAHRDVALQSWTRSLRAMLQRWFLLLSGSIILRTLIQNYSLSPYELFPLFAELSDAPVPSPEYTQFVIEWVLTNQIAGAVIFLLWLVPFYLLLNALTSHALREREHAADIRAIESISDVVALKSALVKIDVLQRLRPPEKRLGRWREWIQCISVALLRYTKRLRLSFDSHPDVRQRLAVISAMLREEVRPLPSPSSVFFSCVASWFLSASLYGLLAVFSGSLAPQGKQLSLGLVHFEIVPDQRWLWIAFSSGLVTIAWANLTSPARLRRMDPKEDTPWFGLLVRLLFAAAVYAFLWGVVPWALSQDVYSALSGLLPVQVDPYDLGRFVVRSTFLRQALPGPILMGRTYSPLTTLSLIVNLWALPFVYAFLALTLMATIWLSHPARLSVHRSWTAMLGLCISLAIAVVIPSGVRDSLLHVTQVPESNDTYILDLRIQSQETVPDRRTWISDIQVDNQGNIYAAGDDQVHQFDANGRLIGHIDLQPYLGESSGGGVNVTLSMDGQLLAHQRPLPSMKWFDQQGQLIADVPFPAGRLHHNRAEYENPWIIHLDRRGGLYANYGWTIVKCTRTGRFALEFDPNRLYDDERYAFLAFGPAGEMYFLDTEEQVIVQFDQFARRRLRFEDVVYGARDPESHFQAAVDPHGNLYLTNTRADRIQVFNSQGRWVMDFELVNVRTGDRLDLAYGVKADNRGNLYAIGPNRREILRFRPVEESAVPADTDIVSRRLDRFHGSGLFISSSSPGAEVLLNEKEMGRTPLLIWNVVPGEHHVLLRSEAWSYFKGVNLADGAITHIDVDLAPDANTFIPLPVSRYIPMPSSSEWMESYGDTELPTWRVTELVWSGETETDGDTLKAGILIDRQGHAYATSADGATHSDIPSNEPTPAPARDSQGAVLLISSIPEGATVDLNGVEIGRTPLLIGDIPILPVESYTVFVRHDTWGYRNSIIDTELEDFIYIEAKLR